MIPAFNEHGCLPGGIYDCTMDEAAQRFGVFVEQRSSTAAVGEIHGLHASSERVWMFVTAKPARVISTSYWWWLNKLKRRGGRIKGSS